MFLNAKNSITCVSESIVKMMTWYSTELEKLGVPERTSSFLDPEKKKIVFNAVIKSHFSFCPLIWIVENLSKIQQLNK